MTTQLVRYEAARTALAECQRIDEVKDIRDKAEAMAREAIRVGDQVALANETEIVVRAERRIGELLLQAKDRKALFIAAARVAFVPDDRRACDVCGRYRGLTHAHHLIPLAAQFDSGRETADHAHAWLCPTHHAAVHLVIGHVASGRDRASASVIGMVLDMTDPQELGRVLIIAEAAWK